MLEDEILDRLEVEYRLDQLEPLYRMVVLLREGLARPVDWTDPWPPTNAAIGRYVGLRHRGRPFSEGAVRHIYNVGLLKLGGHFVDRRKKPPTS